MKFLSLVALLILVIVGSASAYTTTTVGNTQVLWANQYYGWGNKYAYGIARINTLYSIEYDVDDYTHPTYGSSHVIPNDPNHSYSWWSEGNGWHSKTFLVQRGDDGLNYPMNLKIIDSSGNSFIHTSPAGFTFCAAPYNLGACPAGINSPYNYY
jgi:hypothetical protein